MYGVFVEVVLPLCEANDMVKKFVSCVNKEGEDIFAYQVNPRSFLMVSTEREDLDYYQNLADSFFDEQCIYKHISR